MDAKVRPQPLRLDLYVPRGLGESQNLNGGHPYRCVFIPDRAKEQAER